MGLIEGVVSLIPAAVSVISGIAGQNAARDRQNAANEQQKAALAAYAGISIPEIEDQMLNYEKYKSAGQLNPVLEQLVAQGPTALENIQIDPRLRQEQMSALEQMAGLAKGEIKPSDVAAFEMARRNAAGEAQAKQGQILQEMRARGQGGSGAELITRLQSGQSAADRLQQADLEQAAMMQNARLSALQNQANMSGNIRSQDYGQAQDLARARDVINQFNIENARSVGARNVSSQNKAQEYNLSQAQQLANANIDLLNKQQQANKALIQQQFENRMRKAGGVSGVHQSAAANLNKQAGDAATGMADIASGIGGLASGIWSKFPKKTTKGDEPTPDLKPEKVPTNEEDTSEIGWRD